MHCPKCGERVYPTDAKCMGCGTDLTARQQTPAPPPTPEASVTVAQDPQTSNTVVLGSLRLPRSAIMCVAGAMVLVILMVVGLSLPRHHGARPPEMATSTAQAAHAPTQLPGTVAAEQATQAAPSEQVPQNPPQVSAATPGRAPSRLPRLTDDEFVLFWTRMYIASPPTSTGSEMATAMIYVTSPNIDNNEATKSLLTEYRATPDEARDEFQRRFFPNHRANEPLLKEFWASVAQAQRQR